MADAVSQEALRASGLHKRFGGLKAVNDVSFTVKPGETAHLLYSIVKDQFNGRSRLELRIRARVQPPAFNSFAPGVGSHVGPSMCAQPTALRVQRRLVKPWRDRFVRAR